MPDILAGVSEAVAVYPSRTLVANIGGTGVELRVGRNVEAALRKLKELKGLRDGRYKVVINKNVAQKANPVRLFVIQHIFWDEMV